MVSRQLLGCSGGCQGVMCGCYGVTRWLVVVTDGTMEFVAFYWHDLALS